MHSLAREGDEVIRGGSLFSRRERPASTVSQLWHNRSVAVVPYDGLTSWAMRAFRPAILSAFVDYRRADFFGDLSAGITVGIIALPLAIGFGIASGVTPQQGLWTGIIGGLAVALLGGSRFQIAGPTGAFVPVLFATVANYGYGGLAVATIMAGVMLVVLGALKMG